MNKIQKSQLFFFSFGGLTALVSFAGTLDYMFHPGKHYPIILALAYFGILIGLCGVGLSLFGYKEPKPIYPKALMHPSTYRQDANGTYSQSGSKAYLQEGWMFIHGNN